MCVILTPTRNVFLQPLCFLFIGTDSVFFSTETVAIAENEEIPQVHEGDKLETYSVVVAVFFFKTAAERRQ